MIVTLAIGAACGAVVSGFATWLVMNVKVKATRCPEPDAHELSDAEETSIAAEFAAHALRVREGLEQYADMLADGNNELRERLRIFERGEFR